MVRTKSSIRDARRGARQPRAGLRRASSRQHGVPEPRNSERGAQTLLRTIVGQQVSVAAARSMWAKLEAAFGSPPDLHLLLAASDEELRAAGMSRQKSGYIRSLAELVISGELDLAQPARGRRGSDRAPDEDQGHRPLVGGNLPAVRRRPRRRLPGRRPRGDGRARPAHGPRRQAEREAAARDLPSRGGPTAERPRSSPGTATIRAFSSLVEELT